MEAITTENLTAHEGTIIHFFGVLDNQIKSDIEKTFQALNNLVILDFKKSERINSMGITVLLKTLKDFHQQGRKIYYVHLTRLNTKLFRMVGLTKLGKIFENMDDALKYISSQK